MKKKHSRRHILIFYIWPANCTLFLDLLIRNTVQLEHKIYIKKKSTKYILNLVTQI